MQDVQEAGKGPGYWSPHYGRPDEQGGSAPRPEGTGDEDAYPLPAVANVDDSAWKRREGETSLQRADRLKALRAPERERRGLIAAARKWAKINSDWAEICALDKPYLIQRVRSQSRIDEGAEQWGKRDLQWRVMTDMHGEETMAGWAKLLQLRVNKREAAVKSILAQSQEAGEFDKPDLPEVLMPWDKMEDVPESLKGVAESIEEANEIAAIADAIDPKTVDNVWAVAISAWRKKRMKEFGPDVPISELTEAEVRFVVKTVEAEPGKNWWDDEEPEKPETPAEQPAEPPTEEPAETPEEGVDTTNGVLLYLGGKYYLAPQAGDGLAPKAQWQEVVQKWVPVQQEQPAPQPPQPTQPGQPKPPAVQESYPAPHAGRPGQVGGSAPRDGGGDNDFQKQLRADERTDRRNARDESDPWNREEKLQNVLSSIRDEMGGTENAALAIEKKMKGLSSDEWSKVLRDLGLPESLKYKIAKRDITYKSAHVGPGEAETQRIKPGSMRESAEVANGEETEAPAVEEAEIVLIQESGEPADLGEEVNVVNVQETSGADPQSPLRMLIEVIQPGWGNRRDGHYYPAKMLREHAKVFEGAKMFTTDHDPKEHTARNEVSFIDKIVGFSERGAPLAETVVYDPVWAHKVRNLASVGRLDRMHFSIYAKGVQKKATVDGKDGWVVEKILDDPKPYVDWVSNAGAGGQGIRILESDRVREVLQEAKADEPVIARLLEHDYQDEGEVKEALLKEKAYLKEVTGSGMPMLGGRMGPVTRTPDEREKARQEIERRYGLRPATFIGQ